LRLSSRHSGSFAQELGNVSAKGAQYESAKGARYESAKGAQYESAKGAQYESQGQAPNNVRRVAPG